MSEIDDRGTVVEKENYQANIGVGFIISESEERETRSDIQEAHKRGHTILVSCIDGKSIDPEIISGSSPIEATILPSARTIREAREELIEYAKTRSFSGLIVRDPSTSQIDYERSYAALDESEFAAEARTSDAPINDQDSVAAIVPAYNESDSIRGVISSIRPYVDDVIVINDSSTDGTEEIAKKCADRVVTHPKNMGVGGAVHTGYLAAARSGYDIVVQIDADGQHDPSYIPQMVDLIEDEEADMVIGSRWLNESYQQYSFLRRLGIRFFTREVNMIAGINITDVTSGYRAYRTSKLEDLGRPANSHWAVEQTLEAARRDWNIKEISVPMPPSVEGSQFDLETFLKYPPRMALTTLKVLLFR